MHRLLQIFGLAGATAVTRPSGIKPERSLSTRATPEAIALASLTGKSMCAQYILDHNQLESEVTGEIHIRLNGA